MPYCLKPERSIESEVRRLVEKQLTLAIAQLRTIGNRRSDQAVHEARRHVKKVRAVMRLVRPTLGDVYVGANRRMRTASRLLAPIADGEAVVDTVANLLKRHPTRQAGRAWRSIRADLVARELRIDRRAALDRVLPRTARVLRAERSRVATWSLNARGFRALATGLEKSVRRARKAMAAAVSRPTAARYHVWRRRVKDLWFQVRLLEARCGRGLLADERRLEELDGCLGEYHNLVLLERILVDEAPVSLRQTAAGLRLLRLYQAALRRRALRLGRRALAEKPRHFVRRVKRLWHERRPSRDATSRKGSWRHAA